MATDDRSNATAERVRACTRTTIDAILKENGRLRAGTERVGQEQAELRLQLEQLRIDLGRREEEHRALLALVGRAVEQTRDVEDRFAEVEQQNAGLATLYAASSQLHTSLRRADVLRTIEEIVINLVGSDQLVVLGLGDAPGLVTILASVGVDRATIARLRPDRGLLARALAARAPVAALPEETASDGVNACIPLVAAGRIIGAVVIFRLFPHKPVLGPLDMELFTLLGAHAATALYCAELHERHGREGEHAVAVIQDALLCTFVDESTALLAELEHNTLLLAAGAGDERMVHDLRGAAHTLERNATCFGFEGLERLARCLEEACDVAGSGELSVDPVLVALALEAVAAMKRHVKACRGGADVALERSELTVCEQLERWAHAPLIAIEPAG